MKKVKDKSTKAKPDARRYLSIATVILLLAAGAGAFALTRLDRQSVSFNTEEPEATVVTQPPTTTKEQADEADERPEIMAELKEKISTNKFSDEADKFNTYYRATLLADELKLPEAKDYARQTLMAMTSQMRNVKGGAAIVAQLEKLATD